MRVALAAIASFAKQEFLSGLGEVGDRFVLNLVAGILSSAPDDRPNRHQDPRRFGTPTLFVLPLAMPPPLAADERFEKKRYQTVGVGTRHQHDITALAAVAAIRSSARNEFLPAETAAPIPAVARFRMDPDLIDKFHRGKLPPPSTRVEREFL